METAVDEGKPCVRTMKKQLTGKRDDTPLHSAARAGELATVKQIIVRANGEDLKDLLVKQNQAGETALFAAAEFGCIDVVKEFIGHYDASMAGVKAMNGYDALHVAARQGHSDIVTELLNALPELSMTADLSNTTALHTAAMQGHVEVVNILLKANKSLALIARSNGKTALHSASRNGHPEVVRALLSREPGLALRTDKKGQTAFHMAAKGTCLELVEELLDFEPSLLNLADMKGNTALHISARKKRSQIIKRLLDDQAIDTKLINRSGETALDTARKMGNFDTATILLDHGVQPATAIKPATPRRELKQTVSDIKHEVQSQLEHTIQTKKQVKGIAKDLNKLQAEGINNAINSTTVVAVLIATVAFAAIFTVPGDYISVEELAPGLSLGEADVSGQTAFVVFFVFDSSALFISLAVVVVQTSVVVAERNAKRKMVAIINKLMWTACVMMSVAFLAITFIVVGPTERWLAVAVTAIGSVILATTIGTMIYWVVLHRIETRRKVKVRSTFSRSRSCSFSAVSECELLENECRKTMFAI